MSLHHCDSVFLSGEQWIEEDVEGRSDGLIYGIMLEFAGRN
jgi:hypothetical protein